MKKKLYQNSIKRRGKSSHLAELGGAGLPVLFLLITVGILAAGGFFVYKTVTKGSVGISLPAGNPLNKVTELAGGAMMPKVTENDFSFVEDPLIRKHFAAQANVRAFRTTSSSDGRGAGEETVSEVAMTSQTDIRFHTKMVSQGKTQTEMIMIGDVTYVKDLKDGSWWMEKAKPLPTGTKEVDEVDKFTPEDFKEEYTQKTKMTYKKLGEEACPAPVSDRTCYKYVETDTNTVDSPKRTFWFDTKELLLRKETNGYGEFTSTTEYSYNDINVAAPSPTKPVPEGKSIYEMMLGIDAGMMPGGKELEDLKKAMPSEDDINKMMEQYQSDNPTDTGEEY